MSYESIIFINGIETNGLLDTGICVRICSNSLYEIYLGHLEILLLHNFVKLECANGVNRVCVPSEHVQRSVLIVVSDTAYNTDLLPDSLLLTVVRR